MAKIPKKVEERFRKEVPKFQRVLENARDRDVNEADTVTIVTDILSLVFGFDKYEDITSEQAIRGTYCDLAVKVDDKIRYLLEVKAIGLTLKENHLRQAIQYGATEGIPWVILTNGIQWDVYRIKFEQPVDCQLVCSINFLELSSRRQEHQAQLFMLSKEGALKSAIEDYHEHVQVVNRFTLGALIQSDALVSVLRRELRRLSKGMKVEKEEIQDLLGEVLKRDVIEGEEATRAKSRIQRAARKAQRHRPSEPKGSNPVSDT